MSFFRKYFTIFFINYILLLFTKFIFSFYLEFNEIYAIFWGYKFDFAVSAFVALFVMLLSPFKVLSKITFVFLTTLFFFIQIADILYFAETQRHIGYEIQDFFVDFVPLLSTAFSKFFFLSIVGFLFGFILLLSLWKLDIYEKFTKFTLFKMFIALAVSIFFIRGEFQHIPLHPYQANEIGDVKKAQVALNGIYNIVYALVQAKKEPKMLHLPKPKDSDIKQSFCDLYPKHMQNNDFMHVKLEKNPNVVLFFAESWSAKWLKPYGYDKNTTPNFNQMYKEGLKVRYMLANGHRTTEGIFATLTSYPNPLGKSVAKTTLQSFSYNSMIFPFNKAGYSSIFFQGTSKDTSGTGSLAQSLGFSKSYGKRDITIRKYPMNYWGVQDDDLYDFVLNKLPKDRPFIIGINGATTHDSVVPSSFKTKHFVDDIRLNKQLNALYFADYALGRFLKRMEKKFPNTLFVFFADHCSGQMKESIDNYKIPFVIYGKGIYPEYKDVVLSQMDIAPTVIDLTLGNYKEILPNATGKSLIQDKEFFAPYFHNGILGWVENNEKLEYNLQNNLSTCRYNKSKCFQLKTHLLSYTYITQKLLFEGKTKEFHIYRNSCK